MMTRFHRRDASGWGILVVACVALGIGVWSAKAWAAETDDTRLGAERIKIGASQQDAVSPPDDPVDWRYFELEAESSLTISLKRRKGEGTLRMTLAKATGEDVDRVDAPEGQASLELTLAPGLYYLKLTADAAASYSLTISERKKPPSR
jgi:hypothetical protein